MRSTDNDKDHTPGVGELTYTVNELSKAANVGRSTIYEEIRDGNLIKMELRGCTRFAVEDVLDWFERGRKSPPHVKPLTVPFPKKPKKLRSEIEHKSTTTGPATNLLPSPRTTSNIKPWRKPVLLKTRPLKK